MNSDRQKILTDYISYIYTTGRTYDTVGKYIKHVTDFLEMAKEVNRRGYLNYKRENADVMVRHSLMCSAICDLLSYLNIGYGKREKAVKPLEKLDVISDKNKKQLNDFIVWLTDNNDYSSHTVDIYYTSMKKYFEYANEVNMDNCRRFIKSLEEEKLSPATIRLRITAIEKFSKWMKKPIELKRPKMKRKLDISNVPTENEYNRLLEYLKTKLNKDYYFFIKVLGTTGARALGVSAIHMGGYSNWRGCFERERKQVSAFLFPEAITTGGEGLYKGDRQVRYSCCREIRTVDSERFFTTPESMG